MNSQKNNKFSLDNLTKENPFQVPENYFDTLGERISEKIEASNQSATVFSMESIRLKPMLLFAGGFASLAFLIYLAFSVLFIKTGGMQAQHQDVATITEYSIVSELDESVLIEAFSLQNPVIPDTVSARDQEKIIDFLIQENIDISTIIDELQL